MTPEQAALAKKRKFSDHLPRQRQVWCLADLLTGRECVATLQEIADQEGHVFQVNGVGDAFAIIWYRFED